MCGIVGGIAERNISGVLLEGLQLPFSNPVINQANYSNPYAINTAPLPSGLVIPVDSPPTTANTPGFNI